jgi:hypothetical protein
MSATICWRLRPRLFPEFARPEIGAANGVGALLLDGTAVALFDEGTVAAMGRPPVTAMEDERACEADPLTEEASGLVPGDEGMSLCEGRGVDWET